MFSFIPPANEVAGGNVFTPVCHSVHKGELASQHVSQVNMTSIQGGLPSGAGFLHRYGVCLQRQGVCIQWVCIQEELCSEGVYLQEGSASRGSTSRRSASTGIYLWGDAYGTLGRPPRTRKVGSMRPIGMLSCFFINLQEIRPFDGATVIPVVDIC